MKTLTLAIISTLMVAQAAEAVNVPNRFQFQGRILKTNGRDPIEEQHVTFKVQLRSADGNCLLFEETHVRDMRETSGVFTLSIGQGSNTSATGLSLIDAFNNNSPLAGASCTYTPQVNDARKIRVSFDDGTGNGQVTLATDQYVTSVPYAFNANQLSGLGAEDFIRVNSTTTQAKVDSLVNKAGDLLSLASGTSNVYVRSSDITSTVSNLFTNNNVVISTSSPITTTGTVSAAALNTTNVFSNTVTSANVNATNVTATNVSSNVSSAQLFRIFNSNNTRNITISAPTIAANYNLILPSAAGTAGQLMVTDGSGQMSWISPSSLTASTLQGSNVSNAAPATGNFFKFVNNQWTPSLITVSDLRNNGGASLFPASACAADETLRYDAGTGGFICASIATASATQAGLVRVGTGLSIASGVLSIGNITVSNLRSSVGGSMFPSSACAVSETLAWNSISDSFLCRALPLGSNAQAGLLQVGAGLSVSSGVVGLQNLNVTPGNYNVLSVDTYGRVTGGTLATTLAGVGITDAVKNTGGVESMSAGNCGSRPAVGVANRVYMCLDTKQIFRDNGVSWELISSVPDVGTAANKIVQLDSNAKLPAVDGSQLTNLPIPQVPGGNMQVFNSGNTFTVPAGVTKLYIQLWGAGGGGAGGSTLGLVGGGGGGGGGYGAGFMTVTPGQVVNVTVGTGGLRGAAGVSGSPGSNSSVGTLVAAGGAGGVIGGSVAVGGLPTAPLGTAGESGVAPAIADGGDGGDSPGGGAAGRGSKLLSGTGSDGIAPGGGGGGGTGGVLSTSSGGSGAAGRVVIWY